MITGLSHLTILVKNQDEALDFYTKKLGFKKHTDAMFGEMRWLTVCPRANENLEFALMLADKSDEKFVGFQAGQGVLAALVSTNVESDYQEMKSHGVELLGQPEEQPWGKQLLFKDLYGNIFNLVQPQ